MARYQPGARGCRKFSRQTDAIRDLLHAIENHRTFWTEAATGSAKRPGGLGGYDLYLYQRDLDDDTRYTVSQAYSQRGYVTDENGNRLAGVPACSRIFRRRTAAASSFCLTKPIAEGINHLHFLTGGYENESAESFQLTRISKILFHCQPWLAFGDIKACTKRPGNPDH